MQGDTRTVDGGLGSTTPARGHPQYPKIEVFVTRGLKFRAKIQETRHSSPYEVTVGGEEWLRGKGAKYKGVILLRIRSMVSTLVERSQALS